MCTMIVEKTEIEGSGKGVQGWFPLRKVNVSYDHPVHLPLEHALSIDFVNEAQGLGARVAVELTPASAKRLAGIILGALERGDAVGLGDTIANTNSASVSVEGLRILEAT